MKVQKRATSAAALDLSASELVGLDGAEGVRRNSEITVQWPWTTRGTSTACVCCETPAAASSVGVRAGDVARGARPRAAGPEIGKKNWIRGHRSSAAAALERLGHVEAETQPGGRWRSRRGFRRSPRRSHARHRLRIPERWRPDRQLEDARFRLDGLPRRDNRCRGPARTPRRDQCEPRRRIRLVVLSMTGAARTRRPASAPSTPFVGVDGCGRGGLGFAKGWRSCRVPTATHADGFSEEERPRTPIAPGRTEREPRQTVGRVRPTASGGRHLDCPKCPDVRTTENQTTPHIFDVTRFARDMLRVAAGGVRARQTARISRLRGAGRIRCGVDLVSGCAPGPPRPRVREPVPHSRRRRVRRRAPTSSFRWCSP